MAITREQEVGSAAAPARRRALPGIGLLKGLMVTMKHLLQPSITQEYPDEKPNLPPRSRGVIALKAENCTVCWKCSRECPDWCIYIESHKETHQPATGGRARAVKVLDRFAIDYALCMYCGICVEVCPFDALFWAPDFEYAEYNIFDLTHEQDRLQEWTYKVLPPPDLEEGAEPPEEVVAEKPITTGGGVEVAARPPAADRLAAAGAQPPAEMAPPTAEPGAPVPPRPETVSVETAPPPPAEAAAPAEGAAPAAPAQAPAEREHVEPDQETYDRVLAEELNKGTDRRVAEGRARAAAVRAAKAKAEG